jgi:LAO/AO transport system kinase
MDESAAELTKGVLAGGQRALARAATLIESGRAAELMREIAPVAGRALIIGVTGAPGVGKSTLCDQIIKILRGEGKTVGVIAVDPSSPYSGGAILGDRIRMQQHHADPGVFIRSMAARGVPGGLAQATADLATLLDAAGYDVVIIETVGVGQGEIDIVSLAQVILVVLAPGAGDDVQAMKAGLMEIADLFVINKADMPGVEALERDLAVWNRKTLRTVASEGQGIADVTEAVRSLRHAPLAKAAPEEEKARIDHLGIAVRSLDQALKFYEGQLGLGVSMRETVAQEKVNVAMLPLGEPRIELLEPAAPDSVIAKFLETRGEGLHHVALRVPDLQAAGHRLRASGARILNEPRPGAGGHLYTFVHPSSTGGVLLELIQA